MSCRTTHGGTLTTRLARAFSGLPDRTIQSLYHALKREGTELPAPSKTDMDKWRARQQILIKHAPLTEAQRLRSEDDLFRAAHEDVDPATFYAWSRIEVRARQEAVLREMKGFVVDLAPPGSQADRYELGEDGRPARVWYASYGSNLSRERFLTYIEGGTPEGSSTVHEGCRDKDLPTDDVPIRFEGRMHFAAASGRWGGGGVAFMDDDRAGHALGRAYLITMEQFDDVVAQENGKASGSVTVNTGKVLKEGEDEVSIALYGRMVHIGDFNDAPVFTFTGSFGAQEALEAAHDPKSSRFSRTNTPSGNYLRMIGSGLGSTFGLTVSQQADYLRGCPGAEGMTKTEVMRILRTPPDPVKTYTATTTTSTRSTSTVWNGRASAWDDYDASGYPRGWDDEHPSWFNDPAFGAPARTRRERDDDIPDDIPDGVTVLGRGSASLDDLRESTGSAGAGFRVYKTCRACGQPGHTMHDCPSLLASREAAAREQDPQTSAPRSAQAASPKPTPKVTTRSTSKPTAKSPSKAKAPGTGKGTGKSKPKAPTRDQAAPAPRRKQPVCPTCHIELSATGTCDCS